MAPQAGRARGARPPAAAGSHVRLSARALVGAAALLTLLHHAVLIAAAETLPSSPAAWPDLGPTLVNLVALLVPLAVVARMRWWRAPWLAARAPRRPLLLLPALVVCLLPLADGIDGSARALISSAVLFAVLGINEELLSRGVVQEILAPLRPVARVLWVGALFGVAHLISSAWFGRPLDDALTQVVSASAFGVAFAALRMEIVVLWPLALLHGLTDWGEINSPGAMAWWLQLATALFWLAYGLWLARDGAAQAEPMSARIAREDASSVAP